MYTFTETTLEGIEPLYGTSSLGIKGNSILYKQR